MPADRLTAAMTQTVPSPAMRRVVHMLAAAQLGIGAAMLIVLRMTQPQRIGHGSLIDMVVLLAALAGLCLVPAILLARCPARQHLAVALALTPLAAAAGVSVYVN